jgi:hypothetical protein
MILSSIKEKYAIEAQRNSDRITSLRNIENLKQKSSTKKVKKDSFGDIQNYLNKINQRNHPLYMVTPQKTNIKDQNDDMKNSIFHIQRNISESNMCTDSTRSLRMSSSKISVMSGKDGISGNSKWIKNIIRKSGITELLNEDYWEKNDFRFRPVINHLRNNTCRASLGVNGMVLLLS